MTLRLLAVCMVTLSFPANAPAEEPRAAVDLTAEPVHVAMFKNGVGLVVAQVELPAPTGQYRVSPLPDATLGSFWVSWPDRLELTGIKATQAMTMKRIPAASVQELLEANIGQTVDVKMQDTWHRVKILDIPKRHDEPTVQPRSESMSSLPPVRGDLVLLEDSTGIRGVPRDRVQELRFDADDSHYHFDKPMQENVLEFASRPVKEISKQDGPLLVSITYLAKGIAWSPSYVVDISKDDKATISAKSVIVNDLIPLEDTDVELIAGYPHIQFEDAGSAFSLTPLQQILERIRTRPRAEASHIMSNVATQSVQFDRAMAPAPSMPTTPVMGEGAEDLYFYALEDIALKKGERGYHPLFAGEIPYEHLYTWSIPDYITPDRFRRRDQTEDRQVVWHALRLTNTTGNPWTTAPALTMKDGRVLGQDTIHYTPGKASTQLKITQAVAIDAEQTEHETARQRNAATVYHGSYDLVTIQGELAVTNYKDKPVTIEITKVFSGEVQGTDGDPTVTKLARGLRNVNPQSQIVWEIEVEPGRDKTVKLNYVYRVYVNN